MAGLVCIRFPENRGQRKPLARPCDPSNRLGYGAVVYDATTLKSKIADPRNQGSRAELAVYKSVAPSVAKFADFVNLDGHLILIAYSTACHFFVGCIYASWPVRAIAT